MDTATAHVILYGILVFSGISGNIVVLMMIISSAMENHYIPPSDVILMNLCAISLLLSFFRNIWLFIEDLGFSIRLSYNGCKAFMLIWVWLRTVNVWATFCMSFFHFLNIRSQHFKTAQKRKKINNVGLSITIIWAFNLLYAIPAYVYSSHNSDNDTEVLMVMSSSTRPLLGCVWDFPTQKSGIAYAMATLVIHEITPIFLMGVINFNNIAILNHHIRAVRTENMVSQFAAERRATKVILVLVMLFVLCWGSNVFAVNYYNYNRGHSAMPALILANFAASIFIGFSPLILVMGHTKLRNRLKKMFSF
ncbi:olfactory receptor class A-like protein 4 [Protopterus annectens]|uniref:olfactory receptor class A-like protein 4 n=1 Tax=Protopterus annectens TaxID=7888 RepID=UPI001CFA5394|nr:olfactory receptor class A-like protein 4 [Protopterus annectens]